MVKEYIGSVGTRHNLTKYTLSNNVEVNLNDEEVEELIYDTDVYINMLAQIEHLEADNEAFEVEIDELRDSLENESYANKSLRDEVEALETRLDNYKEIIRTYKDFQHKLSKVKV